MESQQNTKDNDVNGLSDITDRSREVASGGGVHRVPKVVTQRNPSTPERVKIGTWNVRTMRRRGKLENVKREMTRNKINVLGLCEVRWKGEGDFMSDDVRVIYSGGKESQRGVAVLLDSMSAKRVLKVVCVSDRLMMVKVTADPVDMVIIPVYLPTSDHDDVDVDQIYEQIEELTKDEAGKDYLVVMGDWNAVVGEGGDGAEIGEYGLGCRNERGDTLVGYCRQRKLMVTNTWFQHEKRRRYTWKNPGDTGRYQLDYILVRQRYRNSVKNSRSYPGADADSDHNLVAMNVAVRFKTLHKSRRQKRWDTDKLVSQQSKFREEVDKQVVPGNLNGVESRWSNLKGVVMKTAMKVIGYKQKKTARKPWITHEMIEKMEERRRWKNVPSTDGKQAYRRLNNELRRETDKAKEKWWKEECENLEEMAKRGRTDLVYAKVKKLTVRDEKCRKNAAIKDQNGKLLTEPDEIRNRWKEYMEELYNKAEKPSHDDIDLEDESEVEEDDMGPELLASEVLEAIQSMKKNKAEGCDGIPAEFWKILGEKGTQELVQICADMYREGVWPKDFTRLILIPLQKKVNATECGDFRTISLIPHASKIMLKILTKRIQEKAKGYIGRNQFGFKKGCGTREAIGVMRMLCERSLEHGNDIYVCYVDFEKAFDRVNWIKMMEILKNIKVDWRDRRMIMRLYLEQEAVIRIADGESEPGIIGRGVRQGCPLSPLLFSIYAEAMMIDAMEDIEEGVKVGGRVLKDVRFADDQAMVATTERGLQKLMDGLSASAKKYDMKVNGKKTKTMLVSKNRGGLVKITVDGQLLEQVNKFKYLGVWMMEDGRCDTEVKIRIAMARYAFCKIKELLTKSMSREVKKKIIKTLVWSVMLYGCETWTMNVDMMKRLDAMEMWCWRRMEKISWRERITNEEVLNIVSEQKHLVTTIVQRKKNWIGHILRGESLLKETIEGRMEGKRPRGRPRKGMIDELKEGSYEVMKRRAEDRDIWRGWIPKTCRQAVHQ